MKVTPRVKDIFGGSPPAPLEDYVVLSRLEDLCAALSDEGIIFDELPAEDFRRLALLAWQSPRLSQRCLGDAEGLAFLLHEGNLDRARTLHDYQRILRLPSEGFGSHLHVLHGREMLRIAWRHICDLAEIDGLMLELSDLADCVIRVATEHVYMDVVTQWGVPKTLTGQEAAFALLAMGKLGGRELNFSSDIDVLFVYRGEGATCGGKSGGVENPVFFERVATGICDLLSRPTAEGFLYRVDTRLRPQGTKGPLAPSLEAIEMYYENWGEDWERQALLKVRPVAGDLSLGEDALRILIPFTYRKYVDEVEIAETLRNMDDMRRRMIRELSPNERQFDIKIGQGGIRDVEFIVQAVQMLYGGQYPEVRLRGTIESLSRMHESGLLHSRDYHTLREGYRFLRRVEHRLQLDQVRQVYQLPRSISAREDLAIRLGFESYQAFDRAHREIRSKVRGIYEGIFGRREWEDQTEGLLESRDLSETRRRMLLEHGFKDPDRAHRNLLSLANNPSNPHLKAKTKRLFKALTPRLLLFLKDCPDADMALNSLEQIVDRLGARTTLYSIMADSPQLVDLLVILTGGSRYLAEILQRDPSLAESLGRHDTLRRPLARVTFRERLNLIREAHPGRRNLQESLAQLKNALELETGIRYLLGISDVQTLGADLAAVAEFILREGVRETGQEMKKRYPILFEKSGEHFGVVAVGKFGGCELNFASDLDLIFFHEKWDGPGEITDTEFFSRWAAKVTGVLSNVTPFGRLYECDCRLRPYGKSGSLSTGLETFERYVRESAWTWERLALTRCRPVAADENWNRRFQKVWRRSLFSRPFTRADQEELVEMRFRIEREKGEAPIKAGPGGLIDVEFIAQTLKLCHGKNHETMRNPTTTGVLTAAGDLGFLPVETARELCCSYLFLRDMENRLQIVDHLSIDRMPTDELELEALAKRCFPPGSQTRPTGAELVREVDTHTRRVRRIFREFFQV